MIGSLRSALVAGAVACLSGCATIKLQEIVRDTPNGNQRQDAVVPESSHVSVVATPDSETILVTVKAEETCTTTDTALVHRIVYHQRNQTPQVGLWEYGGAALLLGAGAYSFFDSSGLSASSASQSATGQATDPVVFQGAGVALAAAGVGLLILGLVDTFRAIDTETDQGIVPIGSRVTPYGCHEQPVANTAVKVTLHGGTELRRRTDGTGTFRLSVADVAGDDLPGQSSPARVSIGSATSDLVLPEDQRETLVRTLTADASTRVAKDLAAAAVARCTQTLEAARHTQITSSSNEESERIAGAAWTQAQTDCGALWTSTNEAEADKVAESTRTNEGARSARRCSDDLRAVKEAIRTSDPDRARELLGTAHEHCDGVSKMSGPLGSTDQELDQYQQNAQRAEAREAAASAFTSKILESLYGGDPITANRVAQKQPALAKGLRGNRDFTSALVQCIVRSAARQVGERVCAAKSLFWLVLGTASWEKIKPRLAEEAAGNDPLAATKAMEIMDQPCH